MLVVYTNDKLLWHMFVIKKKKKSEEEKYPISITKKKKEISQI